MPINVLSQFPERKRKMEVRIPFFSMSQEKETRITAMEIGILFSNIVGKRKTKMEVLIQFTEDVGKPKRKNRCLNCRLSTPI